MAAKPIKMEEVKQILRFHKLGYSIKGIARQTGISRNTIRKYLAQQFDVSASIKELTKTVYNTDYTQFVSARHERLMEHFKTAQNELKRPGVTRQLLWQEYKLVDPEGYNYSQYCYHFSRFMRNKEVVMHLEHKAGHEIMMDFAGKKLSYVDEDSGELIPCEIFISVLPYSGLNFCRAVPTQGMYDFIDCINSMFKYYGGVTQTILCDNLKSAVKKPDRYEPVFTELCCQLGEHYNTYFSATRPYKPRDKAMVERVVKIVYTNIYAPLRNNTFHSIQQLNFAIDEQLTQLNNKKYKGSTYSRMQLFNEQERKLLTTLPTEAFKPKKVVQLTVQRNYHVQLSENHHYYSVPYTYVGKKVKVLYDSSLVEIYYDGQRIAIHHKNSLSKAYHTIADHMPCNHQQALAIRGWTKEDLLQKAANMGSYVLKAAKHILESSIYPEQNYKSCHGLIMLQNKYPKSRIENACKRALLGTTIRYTTIRDILLKGLDNQLSLFDENPLPTHDNIRGPQQYQ